MFENTLEAAGTNPDSRYGGTKVLDITILRSSDASRRFVPFFFLLAIDFIPNMEKERADFHFPFHCCNSVPGHFCKIISFPEIDTLIDCPISEALYHPLCKFVCLLPPSRGGGLCEHYLPLRRVRW